MDLFLADPCLISDLESEYGKSRTAKTDNLR